LPVVPVVPWTGRRRTLGEVLKDLGALEGARARLYFQIGMALNEIAGGELWRGVAVDFWTWFLTKSNLDFEVREAQRYMTVAAALTEGAAKRVTAYRAYQVVAWCRAKKVDANELVLRDGTIEGVPISKHTRETLRAAIARANFQNVMDQGDKPVAPSVKEGKRAARRWKSWAKKMGIAEVKVDVRLRDGVAWARIEVPASELDRMTGAKELKPILRRRKRQR
jgi:hypothetical protein